ncbi:MAG: PRD domain-containing protein [Streptococcaceae bacterium]|nr:PRD domain-containing protein [Streptococcaceae bacterium]
MKETTNEKLLLLRETGIMDEQVFDYIKKIDQCLCREVEDMDNEMLLIHLVMAMNRIAKGEEIEALPAEILDGLRSRIEFAEAKTYFSYLKLALPAELPSYEEGYIMLHLVNILKNAAREH